MAARKKSKQNKKIKKRKEEKPAEVNLDFESMAPVLRRV